MIEGNPVVHEVVLPASREDVFDMFDAAERQVTWIGVSADVEPRPDGRFRFEVMPGQFFEGRHVTVDRPRLIVFTGAGRTQRLAFHPARRALR